MLLANAVCVIGELIVVDSKLRVRLTFMVVLRAKVALLVALLHCATSSARLRMFGQKEGVARPPCRRCKLEGGISNAGRAGSKLASFTARY